MPWYSPKDSTPREQCPCCGWVTLPERGTSLICPICFWEDDVFVEMEDQSSPANGMTVSEAQLNFMRFGAVSQKDVPHVRRPGPEDERDAEWKPLGRTLELL